MTARFNAPPGWPDPPEGWSPNEEWLPDPAWPAPPPQWAFWVETAPGASPHQIAVPALQYEPYGTTERDFVPGPLKDQPRTGAPAASEGGVPATPGQFFKGLGRSPAGRASLIAVGLVVLPAALSSGPTGLLSALGLCAFLVAAVVFIRGRVEWAGLHGRKHGLRLGGAALAAIFVAGAIAPSQPPETPTAQSIVPTSTQVSTPDTQAPQPSPTPTETATSTARATATATLVAPKPKVTAAKPKPRPVATTSRPKAASTPKPAPTSTTSYRVGVTPGAFCSPGGALGYTAKGTLMQCKPSATDARNRWRRA